jgi:hypothetical protein
MKERLFTVAGTATNPDGTTKVRWATDLVSRIKILNKTGCTNINLVELPEPMTKLESLDYLRHLELDADAAYAVACKYNEKLQAARRGEFRLVGDRVRVSQVTEREPALS